MAELTPSKRTRTRPRPAAPVDEMPVDETAALRARIGELEALVEARTQTIVGLGARLDELEHGAPPSVALRIAELEAELTALRATKVYRWSSAPRRWYRRLRGG